MPDNQVGSFTIAVTAEFVKYAHFIDQFQDAGSGEPWISYRHKYTGPVHTNTRFSILGNTGIAGQEGPTFRSEATQTMDTTRFNNGGKATNLKQDSSAKDWPILGATPGIFCKTADCSGFTRAFDFDPRPASPGIHPIPFPATGTPTAETGPKSRSAWRSARWRRSPACPTTATAGTMPRHLRPCGNCAIPVIVYEQLHGLTGMLLGGIYVKAACSRPAAGSPM